MGSVSGPLQCQLVTGPWLHASPHCYLLHVALVSCTLLVTRPMLAITHVAGFILCKLEGKHRQLPPELLYRPLPK